MNEPQVREKIAWTLGEISHRQEAHDQPEETSPKERETDAQSAAHEQEQQQEQTVTTMIHVYIVDVPPSPQDEDGQTIESTLEAEAQEEDTVDEESDPLLPPTRPLFTHSKRLGVPLLLLVLCFFLTVVVSGIVLVPVLTASATVTIIAASTEISSTTTVTLIMGNPHSGAGQVAGRVLSTFTLRQEQVVSTTGTGHQQARAAHGTITLYNALPEVQTVPAGTLLVGANGVQIVTEEDALIPAGSLSTNGQVSVFARALQSGPAGNIRANDIYGACCRADVFAQNPTPFQGGQNARVFPMVTAQDISGALASLKASVTTSVQAAVHTQVHPDETLITPVPCTPKVTTNHAAGDEATQVTVRLDETCTGDTYDTLALKALTTQEITQKAAKNLDTGYTLAGEVQVTVTPSLVNEHQRGPRVLQVRGVGTWAYQFSDAQLRRMAQMLAEKNRHEATVLLLAQPGVSQVAMSIAGTDTNSFPADAGRIRVLVLSRLG
jgi:hypothetical protein